MPIAGASDHTIKNHAAFIWSVADRLRGDYKQADYGKVILPLTVLRRLDCVLEPTKGGGPRTSEDPEGQGRECRPCLEVGLARAVLQHLPARLPPPPRRPRSDRREPTGVHRRVLTRSARGHRKFDFNVQIIKLDDEEFRRTLMKM